MGGPIPKEGSEAWDGPLKEHPCGQGPPARDPTAEAGALELTLFEKRSNPEVTASFDGSIKDGAQTSRVKAQRSLATNISLMLQLLGKNFASTLTPGALCSWLSPSPASLTGESVFSPPLSSPWFPSFSQSDHFILKLENNSNYLQVPTEELAQCSCHPKGVNAITRNNTNRHELKL